MWKRVEFSRGSMEIGKPTNDFDGLVVFNGNFVGVKPKTGVPPGVVWMQVARDCVQQPLPDYTAWGDRHSIRQPDILSRFDAAIALQIAQSRTE